MTKKENVERSFNCAYRKKLKERFKYLHFFPPSNLACERAKICLLSNTQHKDRLLKKEMRNPKGLP